MEPNAERPSSAAATGDGDGDRAVDWSADWSWPPYAPLEPAEIPRFCIEEWAPASSVRRPWVRLGRWTLLYRRAA